MKARKWKRSDWISFSIGLIILLSFIGFIIWWAYISNELDLLKVLFNNDLRYIFYLILICSGFLYLKKPIYHIVSFFYPKTKKEIELKKAKRKLFKIYPLRLVKLKQEEMQKEFELKEIVIEIKKLKNKK